MLVLALAPPPSIRPPRPLRHGYPRVVDVGRRAKGQELRHWAGAAAAAHPGYLQKGAGDFFIKFVVNEPKVATLTFPPKVSFAAHCTVRRRSLKKKKARCFSLRNDQSYYFSKWNLIITFFGGKYHLFCMLRHHRVNKWLTRNILSLPGDAYLHSPFPLAIHEDEAYFSLPSFSFILLPPPPPAFFLRERKARRFFRISSKINVIRETRRVPCCAIFSLESPLC